MLSPEILLNIYLAAVIVLSFTHFFLCLFIILLFAILLDTLYRLAKYESDCLPSFIFDTITEINNKRRIKK